MNKKIKIIELWNIIAQVEDIEKLPKKIKYDEDIYELQTLSRDYYCKIEDDYLTDRVNDKPLNIFLNDTVEILEDNPEEIEEYKGETFEQLGYEVGKMSMAIAKGFEKAIKEMRKEITNVNKNDIH